MINNLIEVIRSAQSFLAREVPSFVNCPVTVMPAPYGPLTGVATSNWFDCHRIDQLPVELIESVHALHALDRFPLPFDRCVAIWDSIWPEREVRPWEGAICERQDEVVRFRLFALFGDHWAGLTGQFVVRRYPWCVLTRSRLAQRNIDVAHFSDSADLRDVYELEYARHAEVLSELSNGLPDGWACSIDPLGGPPMPEAAEPMDYVLDYIEPFSRKWFVPGYHWKT